MARADLSSFSEDQLAAELRHRIAIRVAGEYSHALGLNGSMPTTLRGRVVVKNGRAGVKATTPPQCVSPSCTKMHTGPRFSFLCEEHREVSKAQRQKLYRTYQKAQKKAQTAEKAR